VKIAVVTLFPEMFAAVSEYGVTGRALTNGLAELSLWNPRDYTTDRHQTVDDRPYGGGPGMVMMVEPLRAAINDARKALGGAVKTVYLSPQGEVFKQSVATTHAVPGDALILIAGRYEGIDERLLDIEIDEEWSLGDFVLSGGEVAAMAAIDAIIRLLPGVLGHNQSAEQDSFSDGLLDCPHYTRPETLEGRKVPSVLLSGDHEKIRRWRLKQSLGRTWLRRPALLKGRQLTREQQCLLDEFIEDNQASN